MVNLRMQGGVVRYSNHARKYSINWCSPLIIAPTNFANYLDVVKFGDLVYVF